MFKRKCPECDDEITYKSESGYKSSTKKNSVCRKCSVSGERNPMYGKNGELNPFYGKKHTEESKAKITEGRDYSKYKTKEFRDKISKLNKGSNNPMYGKSFYDVWLKKYGKEIADQKMSEFRTKQSELNSGEDNNMYGKPSPNGSGNGWSGWYNGWFFRSIRELSYMIKIIERYDLKWESGETNKWKIKYEDYNGLVRNYFPDFIIERKYMVEVKPKKLWTSETVILKKDAGVKFCDNNGLIYKLSEIPCLSDEEIIYLYENQKIKFTDRYEEKYKKWLKKNEKGFTR